MSWLRTLPAPTWQLRAKRMIDIAAATTVLTAGAPILLTITAAELVVHGWPPIFVQPRPGFRGKTFSLYKFRSMRSATDADGVPLPDAARLTSFGRFLRSTSLDELPEFINVLRGEMSLVGPRPLMQDYLPRYTERQSRRHQMPPGLTGWAQVNGRNATSWAQRLAYDVEYVDNWSLAFDLKILLQTVGTVIAMHGISAEGIATMPPFTGAPDENSRPQ